MPLQKDKDVCVRFLESLSRIKGWHYHEKIETERKKEIREFISLYVFTNLYGERLGEKISYNRLSFLIHHPGFIATFKALLVLLELSRTENDFEERYQKIALMHQQ